MDICFRKDTIWQLAVVEDVTTVQMYTGGDAAIFFLDLSNILLLVSMW